MQFKNTVILYHKDCIDGFSAAWAAWSKFGKTADYIAISHSDKPIALKGKNIFFLDIAYSAGEFKKLVVQNESVTLIDHHITNRDILKLSPYSIFSNSHSGAYLAWKFFHKAPVPALVRYVEEKDLWKFRLPHSAELNAYMWTKKYGFAEWDRLAKEFANIKLRPKLIASGRAVLDFERRNVEELAGRAEMVNFFGYKILAINSQSFIDRLCNFLASKKPPFALAWSKCGDFIKVSLRSVPKFDVSKIAQRFPGGGGHENSAGFSFPAGKKFPWKSIKK